MPICFMVTDISVLYLDTKLFIVEVSKLKEMKISGLIHIRLLSLKTLL